MKKKYLTFLLFALLIPQISHADFKEKIRPYMNKYLGSELTIKLLGAEEEKIKLPAIPKIDQNAQSLKVFEKNEDVNIKALDPEVERKSNLSYIAEVYKVTRNKKPTAQEISNWMNALSQGGTREGLYRALVLDSTYAGLENFNDSVNDNVTDFAIYFLGEFLDREAKKESISKSNIYTLKRVVTEKTLEVLDEYLLKNKEDFYKWYAVFSGEMGKRYPSLWNSPVRKSDNREAHLQWSKTVPVQHVKSEVIIKIHKIFNFLK